MELGERYDVIIVGARCAGAATGMLLARAGLRVLLVERSAYGTDTLSTHALMRGGVLQLARWGLLPALRAGNVAPIRSTSFHYGEEVVEVSIKPRDGVDALHAPRRSALDALLVDAARNAGADVRHGARVHGLVRSSHARVVGASIGLDDGTKREVRADLVVGADGLHSTLARLVNAPIVRMGRHASSVVYGYFAGLAFPGYRWMYRPGVSAGAIPTHDGLTCVFASAPSSRFERELRHDLAAGFDTVLRESSPSFFDVLRAAERREPLRGFAGHVSQARASVGPGWALVGDAGEYKDPITAHGITQALRDAELLARAVLVGSERALADYQVIRDALSAPIVAATEHVASFAWDLDTLPRHHKLLQEGLAAETKALLALDATFAGANAAAPPRDSAPPPHALEVSA